MKKLLLPAIALLMAPALGAQAQSADTLTNLRNCQPHAKVKMVKDADTAERKAELDLNKAFTAMQKYEASCAAYQKNPSQERSVSERLGQEGTEASTTGIEAKTSTALAQEALRKAYPAVERLGGTACANEMKEDLETLKGHMVDLDRRSQAVANCGKPNTDGPRPR